VIDKEVLFEKGKGDSQVRHLIRAMQSTAVTDDDDHHHHHHYTNIPAMGGLWAEARVLTPTEGRSEGRYGTRTSCPLLWEVREWLEDPTPVVLCVRDHVLLLAIINHRLHFHQRDSEFCVLLQFFGPAEKPVEEG